MTYRQGRSIPHTLYEQSGPEPSDTDDFVGSCITGHRATRLVEAANRGLALTRLSRDDLAAAIESDHLAGGTDAVASLIGLDPDGGE